MTKLDLLMRRNSSLPRIRWLRSLLRAPYHWLMGLGGKGLELRIGGHIQVRVPAEYCIAEMERYEVESVGAIAGWVRSHPGGIFVDVGCSYGYLSCAVRFLDRAAGVIAVDADLASLEVTTRVCRYAPQGLGGLKLVLGLVGSPLGKGLSLNEAVNRTRETMAGARLGEKRVRTNYVCLDTAIPESDLPRLSIDELVLPALDGRPCLIKCDVEGAEQSVIEGAAGFLRDQLGSLLVSVHPQFVGRFGGSVEGIRDLLEKACYQITVLAVDHEEHWLCEPVTKQKVADA